MPLKKPCSGPVAAKVRKPWLGLPPWIQASAEAVEKFRPKVLSRKAQRKMKPVAYRSTARVRRTGTERMRPPGCGWPARAAAVAAALGAVVAVMCRLSESSVPSL